MLDLPQPGWGEKQFEVLGGRFAPDQWETFLKSWQWPDERRWGIWEYVSDFLLNDGEIPATPALPALERIELFGESGHLSARRDGTWVLWHFVGQRSEALPTSFAAESYWQTHPGEMFRQEQKTALLWGEQKEQDTWREDRVGWATLRYTGVDSNRVQVKYWQFTRAGQVAFVWIKGLQPVKES